MFHGSQVSSHVMVVSFLILLVISISTVFTTTYESSSSTPNPNIPLLFTIDAAKYRISTAKLTIDIPTRKLVKKFAKLEGLELDIGRPEHSQVRKVQLALTGLVPAESKWQRTDISPLSRIQWEKVHGLVQELSETLKQWPGVLIDRFALETIEEFNMTIDQVRSDLEELQQATDELFSNWPNQDFLKQLVEFREQLDPIRSAVKDFHSALIKYMQDVKDLWDTDRIPDLTQQNPVTETMRDVKIRVAYYRIPPSSLFDKVLWFLSRCVLGILLVLASFGIITCVLKLYQFIKDAKQQGGATRTADTTTEPMNTTPIQWDLV